MAVHDKIQISRKNDRSGLIPPFDGMIESSFFSDGQTEVSRTEVVSSSLSLCGTNTHVTLTEQCSHVGMGDHKTEERTMDKSWNRTRECAAKSLSAQQVIGQKLESSLVVAQGRRFVTYFSLQGYDDRKGERIDS